MYVKGIAEGKYTLTQASESTGYTRRYLWGLKRKYLEQGDLLFEKRQKTTPPPNKIPEWIRQRIVCLYTEKYEPTNFKYFTKCLNRYEGIDYCYHTVRLILKEYGIESPKKKRKKKKNEHTTRFLRENEGDLIQVDGTPFQWFNRMGDMKYYCLHGAIDDATGKITALYMTENECLYGYLELLRQTITNYGVPREIYSDRAAIFVVTPKNKKNLTIWEELAGETEKRTQMQKILDKLCINQHLANSPQAKGKVERMWDTIQGQLPQYFMLNNISTVEDANKILHKYIEEFNTDYARKPLKADSFYRPLDDNLNLDDILMARFKRKTDHAGVFSFHNYKWKVIGPRVACIDFEICISEKGICADYKGKYYPVKLLEFVLSGSGETMPKVLQNIVFKYMFENAKEVSV